MTAAILLAAGFSRRMGQDKLILLVKNMPLYMHSLILLRDLQVDTRIVVTNNPTIAEYAHDFDFITTENPKSVDGMGTSVSVGVQALPPDIEYAVFLNADQPFLRAQTINDLIQTATDSGKIVVPLIDEKPCSPCVFPRLFFSALMKLDGDQGGKSVWSAHPDSVLYVPIQRPTDFRDIDTPLDYTNIP